MLSVRSVFPDTPKEIICCDIRRVNIWKITEILINIFRRWNFQSGVFDVPDNYE